MLVIGFNSSKYDINMVNRHQPIQYTVKTGGSKFMCVKTDILNYLLTISTTPRHMDPKTPRDAFYSKPAGQHMSLPLQDYVYCLWREEGTKTLEDFLVHYNKKDVTPFLTDVDTIFAFYK